MVNYLDVNQEKTPSANQEIVIESAAAEPKTN
ncbi:unnamed protein product [Camellia sinensis]